MFGGKCPGGFCLGGFGPHPVCAYYSKFAGEFCDENVKTPKITLVILIKADTSGRQHCYHDNVCEWHLVNLFTQ